MISMSVPQTPMASVSTSTGPSDSGGSGISVRSTVSLWSGRTVTARIARRYLPLPCERMFVEPDLLNPDQQAAVRHGEGPLLILAGAGSGKTATLACRVAHLIGSGVEPSRICL